MLRRNNAARLQETVKGVETMTRFALAVLSLASGVYTYLGVRGLLDGTATFVFFAAIIYSAAVSVAIYAFWTFMLRFVPLVTSGAARVGLFLTMAVGCFMIMAMSSWLNAAALAGSAAQEQHLAVNLEEYVGALDQSHGSALAAQSLLPDVQRAADRFSKLADDERNSGALTGTTGSGSVVQLLTQMSQQMTELGTTITTSRDQVQSLFDEGSAHLAKMRELVSGAGEIGPRSDEFASESVQLNAVITSLQSTDVAPSVKRASADLAAGFIAPVADGTTTDLVSRQDTVMGTVRESVAAQSAQLSAAADEILKQPKVEPHRFVPLSSAEAVLRYWSDFIPSWAGAISIDLLPVVLVLVLMIVHDAMRRETGSLEEAETITAAEMLRSLDLYRQLTGQPLVEPAAVPVVVADVPIPVVPPVAAVPPMPAAPAAPVVPAVADATVTPLDYRTQAIASVLMASVSRRVIDWAAAFEDGKIIRAAFFGLLTATGVILYLDYTDLNARQPLATAPDLSPILPAFDPKAPGGKPGPEVTTPMDVLRQPLSVKLVNGGVLDLTGTIDPGAADRVAAEVAAHGEYVKTVTLNSPGGAVVDALAIGRLIREKGYTTSVVDGALCASSCPLVFAGGRERIAGNKAAIGVHQVYAAAPIGSITSQLAAAGNAMSDAQALTAKISRYMHEMGVDGEVWLKALETPPSQLTYLSSDELKRLNLATRLSN